MKPISPKAPAADLLQNLLVKRVLSVPVAGVFARIDAELSEDDPVRVCFSMVCRREECEVGTLEAGGADFFVTDPDVFRALLATLLATVDEAERRGFFDAIRADRAAAGGGDA